MKNLNDMNREEMDAEIGSILSGVPAGTSGINRFTTTQQIDAPTSSGTTLQTDPSRGFGGEGTPAGEILENVSNAAIRGAVKGGVAAKDLAVQHSTDIVATFAGGLTTGVLASNPVTAGIAVPAGVFAAAAVTPPMVRLRAYMQGREPTDEEFIEETALQGGSEAAGGLIAKGTNFAIKSVKGALMMDVAMADDFMRMAIRDHEHILLEAGFAPEEIKAGTKAAFLAAEKTENGMLDLFQEMSNASVFGGPGRQAVALRNTAIEATVDGLVGGMEKIASNDEMALALVAATKNARFAMKSRAGFMHNQIASKMGNRPIRLKTTVPAADAVAGKWDKLAGVSHDPEGVRALGKRLTRLPTTTSFAALKELRTDLDAAIFKAEVNGDKSRFVREASIVRDRITADMQDGLKEFDKARPGFKLFELNEAANKSSREFYEQADREFIRKMIVSVDKRDAGKKAISELLSSGSENRLGFVKELLGEGSSEWQKLRTWAMDDFVTAARNSKTGVTNLGGLKRTLQANKQFGSKASKTLFGNAEYDRMIKTIDILQTAQGINPLRPGGGAALGSEHLVRWGEVGLMLQVGFGAAQAVVGGDKIPLVAGEGRSDGFKAAIGATTLLLTGRGLARFISSPFLSRLVERGTKVGWKTREGVAITSKILGNLAQGDLIEPPPPSMSMSEIVEQTKMNSGFFAQDESAPPII